MNKHAAYWDQGVDQVPRMTGVPDEVLTCDDLLRVCEDLGIDLPLLSLLDVGCGTGRCATLAADYFGMDIAPSAVAYCRRRGVAAAFIEGPPDLVWTASDRYAWVWACSVFTHIDRDEQRAYLAQFVRIAPSLLVDILPDDWGRTCERWGTDEAGFREDLIAAGYAIEPRTSDLVDAKSGVCHRYFVGRRA